MLMLASLVAGLATTPYAAFHFHRVTPYGVLANLAAMPVVSALVMPAGLLGLVAMPFGFDGLFWWIMGIGIDWMIAVTQWVAALPGAVGRVPAFGIGPLIAASLGIILLGLLRTPLRWSGAALVLSAALWAATRAAAGHPDFRRRPQRRRPRPGWPAASDACDKGTRDAFLLKEWLAADADARTAADASLTAGVSCDELGCVMQSAGGGLVAQALRPEALADDCERAALIVTLRQAPAACAASVIDAERLRRQGAMALRQSREGLVGRSGQTEGDRPALVAGRGRRERDRRDRSCAARRATARRRRHAGRGRPSGGGVDEIQCSSSEGLEGWAGISKAPRWNSSGASGDDGRLTSVNDASGNWRQTARSSAVTVSQPYLNMYRPGSVTRPALCHVTLLTTDSPSVPNSR